MFQSSSNRFYISLKTQINEYHQLKKYNNEITRHQLDEFAIYQNKYDDIL